MLMYRSEELVTGDAAAVAATAATTGPPADLAMEIQSENSKLEGLAKLVAVKRALVELRVFVEFGVEGGFDFTLDLPAEHTTLDAATIAAAGHADTQLQQFEKSMRKCASNGAGVGVDGAEDGTEDAPLAELVAKLLKERRLRLRRRDEYTALPSTTFGGRGSDTLAALGLHAGGFEMVHVLLELRSDAAPAFLEYDPDAMHVKLVEWVPVPTLPDGSDDLPSAYEQIEQATAHDSVIGHVIVVDGSRNATVGNLQDAVKKASGVAAGEQRLVWVQSTQGRATELTDITASLRQDIALRAGDTIFLERCSTSSAAAASATADTADIGDADDDGGAAGSSDGASSSSSQVATAFNQMRNSMTIFFNHPDRITNSSTADVFAFCVQLNSNQTVAEAKAAMVAVLAAHSREEGGEGGAAAAADGEGETAVGGGTNVTAESGAAAAASPPTTEAFDLEMLHLRRLGAKGLDGHADGEMLKDEARTLRSYGLFDLIHLMLRPGRVVSPGNFLVKFYKIDSHLCAGDTTAVDTLFEMPLNENMQISELKKILAERLGSGDPARLRLRPLASKASFPYV